MGRSMKIFACTGSGGAGFSFCCRNMVTPIRIGQTPRLRVATKGSPTGTAQGARPKRFIQEVGSGAERSLIQPKKGAWRISMVTKSIL